MQKSIRPKLATLITPMMLAGSLITSNLQQVLVEKLIPFPIETPEQHYDKFPYSDYCGLTRDGRTASATGTSTVLTFGENNSKDNLIE